MENGIRERRKELGLSQEELAKRCGVNCQCVERNIRTVIAVAWKTNPQLLSELAGYSLSRRPKATQFIAILVFYFLQRKPASVTS